MEAKTKKVLKITGITLGSLIGLVLIIVAVACWLIFSSAGLTKVAEKALDKYSPARAKIDDVDLKLVKTYPFLGFRLNGLVIYDDMEDSPYDTLAAINELTVTVDFKTLYKEKKIILTNLFVNGIYANVFSASDGRSNLDVFGTSDDKDTVRDDSDMNIYADLQKIFINDVNASYKDLQSGIDAGISGIDIDLKGLLNYDSLDARANLKLAALKAVISNDSIDAAATLNDLRLTGNLTKYKDDIDADIKLTLKESTARSGTMDADLNDLTLDVNDLSFILGKEGLNDLMAGLAMTAKDLKFSSDGMSTSTGAISMKADKAIYTGDSINITGFVFDSRTIGLNLVDSAGAVSVASVDKVNLGIDGGLKLDMTSVETGLELTLEGTRFESGGESPMSVVTDNVSFIADGRINGKDVELNSTFATPAINLTMGGDVYVPGWPLSLTVPLETTMDMDRFNIKEGANINIDGQKIGFSANGTLGGQQAVAGRARIKTINNLDIDRLISMIPDAFRDALDGIDIHGILGLDLNVRGAVGEKRTCSG